MQLGYPTTSPAERRLQEAADDARETIAIKKAKRHQSATKQTASSGAGRRSRPDKPELAVAGEARLNARER